MRYSLTTDSTLARAALLMRSLGESHLPVYQNDDIVGVISSRDIQRVISMKERPEATPLTVEHFMTKSLVLLENERDCTTLGTDFLIGLLRDHGAQAFVFIEGDQLKKIFSREELGDLIGCGLNPQ